MNIKRRVIVMALVIICSAATYAQSYMKLSNVTVRKAMTELKQKSGYSFVYEQSDLDTGRKVSVSANTLQEAIQQILQGQNVKYEIKGKNVVVSRKPATTASNQTGTGNDRHHVTGTVKDQNGDPIIGATIKEHGTANGTVSDINGNFELYISQGASLDVSYIGFQALTVSAGRGQHLNISMSEDNNVLEDVVVVGYGTQKRINLTGAVESVKAEDLAKTNVVNTASSLAGKVPGLMMKQSSGKPGDNEPMFNIRGFGAPLIIIDGTQQGSFGNIDIEEIESINILKDASAAIYGVQAGNGVILVTTKRGKSGKPHITLNSSFTLSTLTKYPKMMNAGQYAELYNEAQRNDGVPQENLRFTDEAIQHYYAQDDPVNYPSTDWFDVATRKYAPQQRHNLHVSGGNEQVKYFFFVGYADEGGLWKSGDSKFSRYNLRSNIDAKITNNLSASIDLSGRKENRSNPNMSVNDIFLNILRSQPIYHATYPDPTKYAALGRVGANGLISTQKDVVGYTDDERNFFNGLFKLHYDFPFLKNLSAEGYISYYKDETYLKDWHQRYLTYNYDAANDTYTLVSANGDNTLRERQVHTRRTTYQLSLNYQNTFGKHDIKGLFLFEGISSNGNNFSGMRRDYISTAVQQLFAGGTNNQWVDGNAYENGRASYVGRVNYSYDSRYLFEGTLREDGSPKFNKGHQWGLFPSASVGWIVTNEKFMSKQEWLDYLKLRLSYSNTGNDETGDFQYLTGYQYASTYIVGSGPQQTIVNTGIANPFITWENMHTYNFGLEAYFLKDFSLSFDVFYRKRNGMLATRLASVPYSFGASMPDENINSQANRGFELTLAYRKRLGDFNMNIAGNLSYARAKWVHFEEPDYTDPDQIRIYKKSGNWTDRTFGYVTDGFFQSAEQIASWPINQDGAGNTTIKPGDLIYKDLNGDKVIDWKDQDEVGKGEMPTWYYGLNMDFSWKNFSLNMLWQGATGFNFQIIADAKSTFTQDQNGYEYFYTNRWTENNMNAKYPRAAVGLPANQDKFSDFWYKGATYLRLKSLMLTYQVPEKLLKPYNLPSVSIYLAGTNLLTFDSLSDYGYDPEAPNWNNGLYYPQQSTFTIGLKINM